MGDTFKALREGKCEVQIKSSLGNNTTLSRKFNARQVEIIYNDVKDLHSQLMPLSKDAFLTLVYQYTGKMKDKHRFTQTIIKGNYAFMMRHEDRPSRRIGRLDQKVKKRI